MQCEKSTSRLKNSESPRRRRRDSRALLQLMRCCRQDRGFHRMQQSDCTDISGWVAGAEGGMLFKESKQSSLWPASARGLLLKVHAQRREASAK